MEKKILNTIWVMGVLALAGFCLSACNHELDIQQAYPFTVETMPVQKHIVKEQTAEIRCTLKRQGRFEDARYTICYFQPDGKGRLKMDNGTVFKPNDSYPLTKEEFRLYYTSASSGQQTNAAVPPAAWIILAVCSCSLDLIPTTGRLTSNPK